MGKRLDSGPSRAQDDVPSVLSTSALESWNGKGAPALGRGRQAGTSRVVSGGLSGHSRGVAGTRESGTVEKPPSEPPALGTQPADDQRARGRSRLEMGSR